MPMIDKELEFHDLLKRLGKLCQQSSELDHSEVVTLFAEQGFFSCLGYGAIGKDLRLEQRIKRGRIDVIMRGVTGRPIGVIEFKSTGVDDLSAHQSQLEEYVKELLPDYAALTNGIKFWLYSRRGESLEEPEHFLLSEISEEQARKLYRILHKSIVDWQRLEAVHEALKACRDNAVRITSPEGEGGRIFLTQFALEERMAFGRLVRALFEALSPLFNRSDFARGAYAFWERIYARDLDVEDSPRNWREFLGKGTSKAQLMRFMFALETAYTLLSRLMLAKAMQDAGFPLDVLAAYERELAAKARRGLLNPQDYTYAIAALFDEGKRQAFRSLFDSDIFDWWLDLPRLNEAAHEACEALAEVALAIFQFDFSGLSGDLLGQLYQSYFDPETRKALGEFYTPPEVVEFILDHVGYEGPKITAQRMLDPACGSGTFLVHALKRYLAASSGRDPREILRSLTDGFRIVGFDINPFAVLMAQVNYALHLLPTYAEALKQDKEFEIPMLPIFRTDSLRQEKREGEREQIEQEKGGTLGFTFEAKGEVAKIKTELPIEIKRGEFLKVEIHVPRYDRAKHHGWVDNVEEYFRVQHAMFAAVRASYERDGALPEVAELQETLAQLGLPHSNELARYVHPSVEKMLEMLKLLEEEYEDGRFLKTLEDLALAMTLKHELQYDYVVGNPPYVRIQNIPELARKYWQGLYEWAEGNFDIYIPFIERALAYWLKEGGRLGFICSNRFLLANYAAKLRERLLDLAEIELIFDLRDTRVFKDALNYPVIFILRRTDRPQAKRFVASRVFSDPGEGPKVFLDEVHRLIRQVSKKDQHVQGDHADAFLEKIEHLTPQGWYLMPPAERRVFCKLEEAATHRLHELTVTRSGGFQGLATGQDDIFILKFLEDRGDVFLLQPKGGENPVGLERTLLHPWLFGRDVERWHIAWDGWYVLFPYVKIDGSYKLIPCKENEGIEPFSSYAAKAPRMEDFPKAWGYLQKHKEALRAREGERFQHNWYGAARPQNLEHYEVPKILLQVSSPAPDVAFDQKGQFVFTAGGTSGVYGLAFKSKLNRWFLLALLNANPLDFYLKHVSTVYTGHAYSYGDQFIKLLPIRLPKTKAEQKIAEKLAELAQKLTETKGKLRAKERELKAFPSPQLEKLDREAELYPLSRLVQGEPQAAQIEFENVKLNRRLDGSWGMTFGRSELVFANEACAKLAYIWLKLQSRSQVEAEQFMNLKLPQSEQDCRKLLDLLAETEKEIEQLQERIRDGEAQLNKLVAKLYKLTEADQAVIREFLERF